MSIEQKQVSEQGASEILGYIEIALNRYKIGSSALIAFSDFSRHAFLLQQFIQYQSNPTTQATLDNDFYLSNLNTQLAILEEKMKDREVTMKEYGKAHRAATVYFHCLRDALYDENGSRDDAHNKAVTDFYRVVKSRLNRG